MARRTTVATRSSARSIHTLAGMGIATDSDLGRLAGQSRLTIGTLSREYGLHTWKPVLHGIDAVADTGDLGNVMRDFQKVMERHGSKEVGEQLNYLRRRSRLGDPAYSIRSRMDSKRRTRAELDREKIVTELRHRP